MNTVFNTFKDGAKPGKYKGFGFRPRNPGRQIGFPTETISSIPTLNYVAMDIVTYTAHPVS